MDEIKHQVPLSAQRLSNNVEDRLHAVFEDERLKAQERGASFNTTQSALMTALVMTSVKEIVALAATAGGPPSELLDIFIRHVTEGVRQIETSTSWGALEKIVTDLKKRGGELPTAEEFAAMVNAAVGEEGLTNGAQ